jgi:c-di-GMP-binding flagellar brake protein YcgR
MKLFTSDRRKSDRRKSNVASKGNANRRKEDRRKVQRRDAFRVVYPPPAAPEILDYDFRVVDLSAKGIKFACPVGTELPAPGEIIRFTIKFSDCDTHSVNATVLRKNEDTKSEEIYVACTIEPNISVKKINEQQRYLIKHYPDFCRAYF